MKFCDTTRKIVYGSRLNAFRALVALRSKHRSYDGQVYRCSGCHGYHVGSKLTKDRRPREKTR